MKVLKSLIIVSIFSFGNLGYSQSDNKQVKKFNLIDGDSNEVITIREMASFYKNKSNKDGQPIDSDKLFYSLDANKNSIVTLSEYVEGSDWKLVNQYSVKNKQNVAQKAHVKEVSDEKPKTSLKKDNKTKKFEKIDSNSDGLLRSKEVEDFFKGKINDKTGELINGKINFYTYDANDDGRVTLEEYKLEHNWKKGRQKYSDAENKELMITQEQPPETYKKKKIRAFGIVDLNDDLKITYEELKEFYKGKTNKKGNPINAEFKFYGMDTNEDEILDLDEFTTKISLEFAKRRFRERRE
ncbi:hypothetical protein [Winogradskyella sp.]|uniref:hypothetical protein n=1 Tax=Winogradskyella sp. TaxID=1883156 RepID=UPI002600888E|nr:hypothetical protein [Winogradskyella sp.]